jgi:hypothetical protein
LTFRGARTGICLFSDFSPRSLTQKPSGLSAAAATVNQNAKREDLGAGETRVFVRAVYRCILAS